LFAALARPNAKRGVGPNPIPRFFVSAKTLGRIRR